MIRGGVICPFNVLNLTGKATFCHDGIPSAIWNSPGEDHCEAYASVNPALCRTDHCKIVVELGVDEEGVKEMYQGTFCEWGDYPCPYTGCRRLRPIEPHPIEAIIKQEVRETREKESKAEATT
jgi:hypothetical protein